jgi:hypothetical protein
MRGRWRPGVIDLVYESCLLLQRPMLCQSDCARVESGQSSSFMSFGPLVVDSFFSFSLSSLSLCNGS